VSPLSRRTVLGSSALLAVGLSACDEVPLEQTRPGAFTAPSAAPVPQEDPDRDLLDAALLLEATQVARVARALRTGQRRPLLVAARRVHQAHIDLLRGDDDAPPAPRLSTPPARVLANLPSTELSVAEQHAKAALAAQSGPFARVLASMAAAARQQAHVLADLGAS
jgi:hypothetical protein